MNGLSLLWPKNKFRIHFVRGYLEAVSEARDLNWAKGINYQILIHDIILLKIVIGHFG